MFILINKIGIMSINLSEKYNVFNNDSFLYIKVNYPNMSFSGFINFFNTIWGVNETTKINSFTNNDFIYECLIKSILLKINYLSPMTSNVVSNNHWVGFYALNNIDLYSNFWLMCLVRLLNHKLFWVILWGFILLLMQLMPNNRFINYIVAYIYSFLEKLLIVLGKNFFSKKLLIPRGVGVRLSNTAVHSIVFGVGSYFYFIFGYVFDRYKRIIVHDNTFFFNNTFLTYNIVGLLYAININIGVFSTNSFWHLTNSVERPPIYILTTLLTGVFAFWWRYLGTLEDTSHILRSIAELSAFTCVSWSTYALWGLWSDYLVYPNIYGAIFGFIFHIFFSLFAISNEMENEPNTPLYGVLYVLSFTGAAFSTNGLYGLITTNYTGYWISLLLTILGFVLTVVFHPNVYRDSVTNNRNVTISVMIYVMSYFILLFSFVTSTGLLYQLILNALTGL